MKYNYKLLKQSMIEKKYTCEDLARICGLSKSYIMDLVQGYVSPSYKTAIIIAAVFNLQTDELFYRDCLRNVELRKYIRTMSVQLKNESK